MRRGSTAPPLQQNGFLLGQLLLHRGQLLETLHELLVADLVTLLPLLLATVLTSSYELVDLSLR